MLKIHSCRDGRAPATEYMPAAAGTYAVGQPLVMSGGKLTAVASGVGQDTDEGAHYVCMADRTVATAGELIPVVPTSEDIIWETVLAVANTALAIGTAYGLSADGAGLTATTTNGCFTVLESDGTAAGDRQRGILK